MSELDDKAMDELIDAINYSPCPRHEEGWRPFTEIFKAEKARNPLASIEGFRRAMIEKVLKGELEKRVYGKNTFFRVKKP